MEPAEQVATRLGPVGLGQRVDQARQGHRVRHDAARRLVETVDLPTVTSRWAPGWAPCASTANPTNGGTSWRSIRWPGRWRPCYPVAHPARALALAPAGGTPTCWRPSTGRAASWTHVDLASGATRRLATVPGLSLDLAVTGERIYLPRADGGALLVLDRQQGRVAGTIPVGRRPLGLTLGASGAGSPGGRGSAPAPLEGRAASRGEHEPVRRPPAGPASRGAWKHPHLMAQREQLRVANAVGREADEQQIQQQAQERIGQGQERAAERTGPVYQATGYVHPSAAARPHAAVHGVGGQIVLPQRQRDLGQDRTMTAATAPSARAAYSLPWPRRWARTTLRCTGERTGSAVSKASQVEEGIAPSPKPRGPGPKRDQPTHGPGEGDGHGQVDGAWCSAPGPLRRPAPSPAGPG